MNNQLLSVLLSRWYSCSKISDRFDVPSPAPVEVVDPCLMAKVNRNDVVYDLGCGWGYVILICTGVI